MATTLCTQERAPGTAARSFMEAWRSSTRPQRAPSEAPDGAVQALQGLSTLHPFHTLFTSWPHPFYALFQPTPSFNEQAPPPPSSPTPPPSHYNHAISHFFTPCSHPVHNISTSCSHPVRTLFQRTPSSYPQAVPPTSSSTPPPSRRAAARARGRTRSSCSRRWSRFVCGSVLVQ